MKGMDNFCNAQILLDLTKYNKENLLINRYYRILALHSSECIELNFNNIPIIKKNLDEKEYFWNEIFDYLEKINFFNKKIIYNDIYKFYLDKRYSFPFNKIISNI